MLKLAITDKQLIWNHKDPDPAELKFNDKSLTQRWQLPNEIRYVAHRSIAQAQHQRI